MSQVLAESLSLGGETASSSDEHNSAAALGFIATKIHLVEPHIPAETLPLGERLIPSSEELHQMIVTPDLLAPAAAAAEKAASKIEVENHETIRINGKSLTLLNDRVFLFNGFLTLRDRPRALSDYIALLPSQLTGKERQAFGKRLILFISVLNEMADEELIAKVGNTRSARYVVKNFEFLDERLEPPVFSSLRSYEEVGPEKKLNTQPKKAVARASKPRGKQNRALPLLPCPPFEVVDYPTPKDRANALTKILLRYQNDPRSERFLKYVMKESTHAETEDKMWVAGSSITASKLLESLPKTRRLSKQEHGSLFQRIEYGLSVFSRLGQRDPTTTEDEALAELSAAYKVLHSCNVGLVVEATRKFGINWHDSFMPDLMQFGFIGLGEGLKRFKHQKDVGLPSYVSQWIETYMRIGIADTSRTIRLPVEKHKQWARFLKGCEHLVSALQREPTLEEIVDYTGLNAEEIVTFQTFGSRHLTSLNTPVGGKENSDIKIELGDTIADEKTALLDHNISNEASLHPYIERLFEQTNLSKRSQLVLGLKYRVPLSSLESTRLVHAGQEFTYGELVRSLIAEEGELSDDEIANLLGISEESLATRVQKSLKKIRESDPVPPHLLKT